MRRILVLLVCAVLLCCGQADAAPAQKPVQNQDIPVIKTAKQYIGVKYVFGGATPKGFDCSGYVQYVFARHDKKLPRTADVQFTTGRSVGRISDLKPGDLVFFATGKTKDITHVGIYLGKDEFINAQTSKGVAVAKLNDTYWRPKYAGARRVL